MASTMPVNIAPPMFLALCQFESMIQSARYQLNENSALSVPFEDLLVKGFSILPEKYLVLRLVEAEGQSIPSRTPHPPANALYSYLVRLLILMRNAQTKIEAKKSNCPASIDA